MKHLILTRFNVRMPGWNRNINLDDAWLTGRFDLFETICLPSVAAQTCQNFEWLVYFDQQTPRAFRERIDALVREHRFRPVYIDTFDITDIASQIQSECVGEDYLLTSRLDSDDVLAVSYVASLQKICLSERGRRVINFDNGAILYLKEGHAQLYEYQDTSNPFASLLEPLSERPRTILAVNHTELASFADVRHEPASGMWLQVVHGGNVSNRVRGRRVAITSFDSQFPSMLALTSRHNESAGSILMDRSVLQIYRTLRDGLRRLAKWVHKGLMG